LFYFERASAHILAGWNPKIPNLDLKTRSAIHLCEDIDHANQLNLRLEILAKSQKIELRIPSGWKKMVERIDNSDNVWDLLLSLYLVVKRKIVELYRRYLRNVDPIAEYDLIRSIKVILREKKEQVQWAQAMSQGKMKSHESKKILAETESYWKHRSVGRLLEPRLSHLPVGERVPRVARPSNLLRGKIGALKKIPVDGLRNTTDIGMFLHGFLNEEYLTMELICRNIYEHPDPRLNME
jgi:hypothetical protein